MVRPQLDNYLATYRKHSGLSQREVAWIAETGCQNVISRYETGDRLPTLVVALRLEILFGIPIGALFAGQRDRLARRVERRIASHYRRVVAESANRKGRGSPARETQLLWHQSRPSRRSPLRS